jgi:hypothetical protein
VRFPKPEAVRGIYLTAWSAGSKRKMEKVVALLRETQLNALVIDLRDAGRVYFKTDIELAKISGATTVAVVNPGALMALLENEGIYPIARIACFRDDFLPKARPDLAVQLPDGRLWKDRSGHTWLDPYNEQNWEYLASIVDFALELGFPEIQLDYVRFPSEGRSSTMTFPAKKTYNTPLATPTQVVAAFGRRIRDRVKAKRAILSADVFGIMSVSSSDQGIGQELEIIAEPFDLICPMVYPSHFAKGEYGIKDPNRSPYNIVKKSLSDFQQRLPGRAVRPWLQDFSLGVKYGKVEVQSQIRAAAELGYNEFLLWNPKNQYTFEAVKELPKAELRKDDAKPPSN